MTTLMYWWLFLEGLVYVRFVDGETYQEYIENSLSTMCPFTTFCKQGPSMPFTYQNKSPCCKPCSCDRICKNFGNCCPDYDFMANDDVTRNHVMTSSAVECKVPAYMISTAFNRLLYGANYGINLYYVIDSCPGDHGDTVTASMCMDSLPAKLVDAVAVSDSSGRVYKNRHCAVCNGIGTFKTWTMKMICTMVDVEPAVINLDWNSINNGNCIVYSEPPNLETGLQSRCFNYRYSECNETGRWKKFNEYTQMACASSTYSYISSGFITLVYKNPFCYLCNENNKSPNFMGSVCQSDTLTKPKYDGFVAFETILSINDIQNLRTTEAETGICKNIEIRDPYFNICRPLQCPLATVPRNEKCVNPYKHIQGLSIGVQIEFTALANDGYRWTSIAEAIQDIKAPTTTLVDAFLEHFNHVIGCPACTYKIYVDKVTERIEGTILFGFVTTSKCPIASLLDLFNKWRNDMKTFRCVLGVKDVFVNSTVSHDFKEFAETDNAMFFKNDAPPERVSHFQAMELALRVKLNQVCPKKATLLWEKFYCAYVDIGKGEYSRFLAGELSTGSIKLADFSIVYEQVGKSASNERNFTYRICVADYLKRTSGTDSLRLVQNEAFVGIAILISLLYIG